MNELFLEIAIVIVTAGVFSLIALALRQPMIIAYIATGLVAGPSLLGFAKSPEVFEAMSQVGIAFLLFLVGLHLNWKSIKDVGVLSVMVGMGQVIFTSLAGTGIALALGFNLVTSVFIGVGFAFSSTIIIVKLLTDKEDINRFYGRISIGTLIIQDLAAMAVLLFVATITNDTGLSIELSLLYTVGKLIAASVVLWLLAKYVVQPLFSYIAREPEMLFLASVAWCFAIASGLSLIGFSIEIGALLAGIALAGSEVQREIDHKVRPLRDFFIIIFFIVLGTHLTIDSIAATILPALLFSAFILIGNPLIIMIVMRLFGYHPRTGFLVGVTMAQISEFSFIMMSAGLAAGYFGADILSMTTFVGLFTIVVSTYLIKYNEEIFEKIAWMFRWFETKLDPEDRDMVKDPDIVVIGAGLLGKEVLKSVREITDNYSVLDFDPHNVRDLRDKHEVVHYGDAGNFELLESLKVDKAKMIISTIGDLPVNIDIINFVRERNEKVPLVVAAKREEEAAQLYNEGATFVMMPHVLSGEMVANILKDKKTNKRSWSAIARRYKKELADLTA
jgi:Kef-type K+ transport system membrane component KefB